MGRVIQLEGKQPSAVSESPLTPELKDFIDRAIVPLLVKQYLAELDGAAAPRELAPATKSVAKFPRTVAESQGARRS